VDDVRDEAVLRLQRHAKRFTALSHAGSTVEEARSAEERIKVFDAQLRALKGATEALRTHRSGGPPTVTERAIGGVRRRTRRRESDNVETVNRFSACLDEHRSSIEELLADIQVARHNDQESVNQAAASSAKAVKQLAEDESVCTDLLSTIQTVARAAALAGQLAALIALADTAERQARSQSQAAGGIEDMGDESANSWTRSHQRTRSSASSNRCDFLPKPSMV
jgi:hypothetical protein